MSDDKFYDVFYQPGENPVFCYRSGLMVYEETLQNGVFVSSGYNAAGYPLNVLTNVPSRLDPTAYGEPYAFELEINGINLGYGLEFDSFVSAEEDDGLHAMVILKSTLLPVEIHVHTKLDGTQMLTRWIRVLNLSDQPLNISRIAPLSGGLETLDRAQLTAENDPNKLYSIGYFDEDRACNEGDFSWHTLYPDTTSIDTRFNRDRFRHPLLFIRNNLTGTFWFSQIGWSGGCRYSIDLNAKRGNPISTLSLKAEITGISPLYVLDPDTVYTSPEVHMGIVAGDLDDAVNEMYTHIRRSVLNLPEADPSACLVGCGMGAEHDMSVETSKAFIDQFAEMGGEIFIIDAGWQNPPGKEMQWHRYNGTNIPNSDRYPNGISELSDYCHKKGLKFAMWAEIERLGEYSPIFLNHPEWRLKNIYGKQISGILDMTNPEAAAWAENELARFITEYKLDLLRVDYNVDHRDYFTVHQHNGSQECTSLRHIEAVYKMYGNLKKRFPNVIFENCASGGARTDLGMMKAFNHTWVSDWQKMPRSVLITNGLTMALPPERVDRLFAGMGCHELGSFDAHMRNTMLSHMSLNVISPAAASINPAQMAFVKHSVRLYKDFIRPFLPNCKVYHHTPDNLEATKNGCVQLEIAANDRTRGVVGVFTLSNISRTPIHVPIKGVDASKTYRITLDNTQMQYETSGSALLMNGISIHIAASLKSELILYEEV